MINKTISVGRLGKDPDTKSLTNGNLMTRFSLALNERWVKDGQKQEKTEWLNVVAFGKVAEICDKFLSKGSLVYIDGKIQTRSWEDDGVKKYATEVVAQQVQILEFKNKQEDDFGF